ASGGLRISPRSSPYVTCRACQNHRRCLRAPRPHRAFDQGRGARGRRGRARSARPRRCARRRARRQRRLAGQPVAQKGGAAVVPPQRHERDFRRARQSEYGLEFVPVTIAILVLLYVPLIWIGLALGAKRLHDRDKSAWWLLVFYAMPTILSTAADRMEDVD